MMKLSEKLSNISLCNFHFSNKLHCTKSIQNCEKRKVKIAEKFAAIVHCCVRCLKEYLLRCSMPREYTIIASVDTELEKRNDLMKYQFLEKVG